MCSLPVHGLVTTANLHPGPWLMTDQPGEDRGLTGPPPMSPVWLPHRVHDGENAGPKAERRAGTGPGRPCVSGAWSYV